MKTAFSLIALLSLCTFAPADCRRVVRVQQAHVQEIVAVAPVVAAVYAPVPVYSVGYHDNNTEQLLAEVRELRQQLQRLQSGPAAIKQPSQVHPGLTFLKKSCVACHDAQVSNAKGGGNTFFSAGELVNLTPDMKLAVVSAVYAGRMPKNTKATDEDVGAVINFFDQKTAVQKMPVAGP